MRNFLIVLFLIPFIANAQQLGNSATQQIKWFKHLGTYYNMYIGNRMPFIDVEVKGAGDYPLTGVFLVDYGTDVSVIDLKAFPGDSLRKSINNQYLLSFVVNKDYKISYSNKCKIQSLGHISANGIREAGIIGTDILSKMIVTLDYKNSRLYMALDSSSYCRRDSLLKYGLVPVSTKGYFLRNARAGDSNIPTIPVTIGDVKNSAQALAQIDPGYDDRCHLDGNFNTYYTHIVNINKLYLQLLKRRGVAVNVDKKSYYTLGNVSGVPDTLYKCSFSKRYVFNIIGTKGEIVMPYGTDECHVFLKVNAPGGEIAGGITTLPFPAVQLGGSFLLDCDKVAFDPFRSLVWFQSKRSFKRK